MILMALEDTSAPGHFGTGAEVSVRPVGHFGTSADIHGTGNRSEVVF